MISKNRDWNETSMNTLEIFTTADGYKYFAIVATGDEKEVKGGINEKGVVVFTATAVSVSKEDRESDGKSKIRMILSSCSSVDEVIKNQEKYLLGTTQYIIIADNKELACVEISPENEIRIERTLNGTLSHTNHFLSKDFLCYNENEVKSSIVRDKRIKEL